MTVREILVRRAQLQRELATLDADLAEALDQPAAPPVQAPPDQPDKGLSLAEAADLFGDPPSTFRRRLEYRKALISRPGERRLRYSRAELERIRRDRLARNGGA